MEPRIQYAQTKDGVSIAYWTMGQGLPLLILPSHPATSTQASRQIPEARRWNDRLAKGRMLVRYDPRGAGLSDRQVADLSLNGRVLDLEAVTASLGLDEFALFAYGMAGPLAITYAAHHRERVSHLLLWCTYARMSESMDLSRLRAVLGLADVDWELFTETIAGDVLGWPGGDEARRMATYIRENATPEVLKAGFDAMLESDVTDLLPKIGSPTLVLHRRRIRAPGLSVSQSLASRIPHARLVVLEGEVSAPFAGDVEEACRVIDEFLGKGEDTVTEPQEPGGFRTVLFTDVEGSTALTGRLGDAKARDLLREHERTVREALKAHGGSEVKTMGDGFMTSFSSATKALECAIVMQRAFAERNESAEEPIKVRVGLNAGEPIAEEDPDGRSDLFGTAVNEAARITAAARGGEILVADVVRQLTKGKDFLFADRGETSLSGFEDPVRLFEVRWRPE